MKPYANSPYELPHSETDLVAPVPSSESISDEINPYDHPTFVSELDWALENSDPNVRREIVALMVRSEIRATKRARAAMQLHVDRDS